MREFSKQLPTAMQIRTWHNEFEEEGCLCWRKASGRPKTSEQIVKCVCKKILQIPKKSLRRTSLETQTPPTTGWCILRKRLTMRPYKLQLVQAITAEDKRKRKPNWRVPCFKREIGYEIHISLNLSFLNQWVQKLILCSKFHNIT